MKKRERILLIVVGVMVVGWLGYSRMGAISRGPFAGLDDEIGRLTEKRNKLARQVETLTEKELAWQGICKTTIADNVEDARRTLDQQLKDLIGASGVTQVSLGSASVSGRVDDIQQLTVPLIVEGSQKNVTDFLVGFYNRLNFPAQLREFTLSPASEKTPDRLRLTAKAQTILMPAVGRVGKIAGPAPEPLVQLALAPEAYTKVAEAPIWKPYTPPPPLPPPAPQPQTEPEETVVVERPPRDVAPPEPEVDDSVIVALLAGPGVQEIRTRDNGGGGDDDAGSSRSSRSRRSRRNRSTGPTVNTYKLGDKVGDGELVFVHPYGAVIRIGEDEYLYPIGAAISSTDQRYPVEAVPAVRDALNRLRESATPTSQPVATTGT